MTFLQGPRTQSHKIIPATGKRTYPCSRHQQLFCRHPGMPGHDGVCHGMQERDGGDMHNPRASSTDRTRYTWSACCLIFNSFKVDVQPAIPLVGPFGAYFKTQWIDWSIPTITLPIFTAPSPLSFEWNSCLLWILCFSLPAACCRDISQHRLLLQLSPRK